jgi:hypothetical protein
MRNCGECNVCCIIAEFTVQEHGFDKKTYNRCPKLTDNICESQCTIYDNRPKQCAEFTCLWIDGFGNEEDQPNKNHLLTCVRTFNNGTWIIAIENKKNAVNDYPNMLIDLARKFDIPIIIRSIDSNLQTGDKTVIKNSLLHRAKAMTGPFIKWLDEEKDIGLYELTNPESN